MLDCIQKDLSRCVSMMSCGFVMMSRGCFDVTWCCFDVTWF